MTETRTHARLSPSSAERWTTCPGSVQLEAAYPDTSSEHADWGTCCHTVAEWILTEWNAYRAQVVRPALAYKGRRIDLRPGKTMEFTDEMAEVVDTYVFNILDRIDAYDQAGALSVDMHVEVQVPIDHITGEDGATGTADCVLVATFIDCVEVYVGDLKGGRGVEVSAERNKQGATYAAGVLRMFVLVPDNITIAIHQPRVREAASEWTVGIEEFDAFVYEEIMGPAKRAVLFIDSETPPTASDLVPSDKGCRFCKAKATCPALQRTVQDAIGADFEDLTENAPDMIVADLARKEPLGIGACMDLVDLIESWCKAVRAEVERRLFDGQEVPGYKLVQGRKGARAWANAEEAEKALKAYRLKVEEMYDLKLISPTSAEKLAKAGTIGPRQWPKLQALITQSEGSPSVAPESDKRPALIVQKPSADDFDSLVEDDEGSLV